MYNISDNTAHDPDRRVWNLSDTERRRVVEYIYDKYGEFCFRYEEEAIYSRLSQDQRIALIREELEEELESLLRSQKNEEEMEPSEPNKLQDDEEDERPLARVVGKNHQRTFQVLKIGGLRIEKLIRELMRRKKRWEVQFGQTMPRELYEERELGKLSKARKKIATKIAKLIKYNVIQKLKILRTKIDNCILEYLYNTDAQNFTAYFSSIFQIYQGFSQKGSGNINAKNIMNICDAAIRALSFSFSGVTISDQNRQVLKSKLGINLEQDYAADKAIESKLRKLEKDRLSTVQCLSDIYSEAKKIRESI